MPMLSKVVRGLARGPVWYLLPDNEAALPACDLLLDEDVLQHWSNRRVRRVLELARQNPFVLLVNDHQSSPSATCRTTRWPSCYGTGQTPARRDGFGDAATDGCPGGNSLRVFGDAGSCHVHCDS